MTNPTTLHGVSRRPSVADFDLHGVVSLRLIDASDADVAGVTRQVGPIQASVDAEPDITVRFVPRLPRPRALIFVGLDDAAFTEDEFVVSGRGVRAAIDLSQVGDRVEIVCESGGAGVPLLIPVINLTALANGFVALHASAFVYQGTGVVVAGWSKGGKTEVLLAFAAKGAQYVGDEWIYLDPSSNRVVGIPEPIRIWDWHLTDGVPYRELLSRRTRLRFSALKAAAAVTRAAAKRRATPGLHTPLTRAASLLQGQLWVKVPPERMFGRASCVAEARVDQLFLALTHDAETTEVRPATPEDAVPARIAVSTEYERLDFLSNYLKFRYGFPTVANGFIERAADLERDAIARALSGVPAHIVKHPFPADIPRLFDVMEPVLVATDNR